MKALVADANGFVGCAVLQRLSLIRSLQAVGSVRRWVDEHDGRRSG